MFLLAIVKIVHFFLPYKMILMVMWIWEMLNTVTNYERIIVHICIIKGLTILGEKKPISF